MLANKEAMSSVTELLARSGLKVFQAARLSGLSRATVSRIKNGWEVSEESVESLRLCLERFIASGDTDSNSNNVVWPQMGSAKPRALSEDQLLEEAEDQALLLVEFISEIEERAFRGELRLHASKFASLRIACKDANAKLSDAIGQLKTVSS